MVARFASRFLRNGLEGGLDAGRVQNPEGAALHAGDGAERLDVGVQVGKIEGYRFPLCESVQSQALEAADGCRRVVKLRARRRSIRRPDRKRG